MQAFRLTKIQFLKIIFLLSVFVLSSVLAAERKEPDKVVSRDGPNRGVSYVNFVEENFSYLNITALGGDFVDNMPECSFACLDIPSCFSFNLGTTPEANDRFRCELLPSDKYNNSDKFLHSLIFHHFSIATPCRSWPCQNNGKCLPVYEENDYKCICEGFRGKNCEKDIDECFVKNECHQNAICNNTKGSYNCTCKGGFKGDGRLNCTEHTLQDSVIIGGNLTYFANLSDWLKPVAQINGQWILCWRASLHGWAAKTFHSLCDNKRPTLTIVKDTNNNIFGGYTSKPWKSTNSYQNDPKASLFSLKNPANNPRELPQLNKRSSWSMADYARCCPTFGSGWDLHIANNANVNNRSHEKLGYAYTVPSGILKDPFLTGNKDFTANEVETFYYETV
ncbi:PREDICTED: protein jagged-1-like isoform X4 [Acropora digitifera]|uniref:protein jagged-1-like isoform X4 n=1 Tax=Acropora digitifera TaxID=70779 RepID=UPI00077A68D8|nr:PREDICTED: protein jagged-1-like isoform X4 [Acropora digitifera]